MRYAFSDGLLLCYKDSSDKPLWKIDVSSPKWSFEHASSCWEKICKNDDLSKSELCEDDIYEFYQDKAILQSCLKEAMKRKKETALGGRAVYVAKKMFLSGDYVWLIGDLKSGLSDFGETYSTGWLCVNKKTGVIENAIPRSFSLISHNENETLFGGVGKKVLYLYSTNGMQVATAPVQMPVTDVRVSFDESMFVREEGNTQGKLYTMVTVSGEHESKEQLVVRCLPRMQTLVATYGRGCTAIVFCIRLSADSRNAVSTSFGMEEIIYLSRMTKEDAEAKVKNEHVWANTIFPDRPTW